jgi:DNA-binding NtrC family response regulator
MKARLLVVDKNEALLGVISSYLSDLGYVIDTVSSRFRAQSLINSNSFDLLIFDLFVIHEHGFGLLQDFLRENPDSPTIVLTSMGYDARLLQQAFANGATASISKTMPIENLARMITICLHEV